MIKIGTNPRVSGAIALDDPLMRFGSVCSGIEAASVAWHPLGWKASFLSEIEKFPRAVLSHHYTETPLHGDFTTITEDDYDPIDLLVGGTPCQSFSVAGLRKGLADARGNLALEYIRLAQKLRPRWLVWENVPGVLSSNGGRDFGSFLGALGELGYGFAYRVLDAQYFGVAQRRRRVFVVGCLGDWRLAAAVLFERQSLQRTSAPRREGQEVNACNAAQRTGIGSDIAHTLKADGFDARLLPICFQSNGNTEDLMAAGLNVSPTIRTASPPAVAFAENSRHEHRLEGGDGQRTGALSTGGGKPGQGAPTIASGMVVRRLTPVECERLQGFPDDYTAIPWRNKADRDCPDGPRYKALRNSMAVPVMRWIGERIQQVEYLDAQREAEKATRYGSN